MATLYRAVATSLIDRTYALALVPGRETQFIDPSLTPETLADRILSKNDSAILREAARRRFLDLLQAHQRVLEATVREDLASRDAAPVFRAFVVIGELRWSPFFDDVVGAYQRAMRGELLEPTVNASQPAPSVEPTNATIVMKAPYVLRSINDPRAIQLLLDSDATQSLAFFEILRSLSRARAPDPALAALLRSNNPDVRWRATYALAESGDQSLVPEVLRLTADPDARVRQAAANMGFLIPEPGATAVRPRLVTLLHDRVRTVRYDVALSFAAKRDVVCAPALHELITGGQLEQGMTRSLVEAMQTLTGTYFGYERDELPETRTNRAAMRRFAAWFEQRSKR